jgi:hypothetical protein
LARHLGIFPVEKITRWWALEAIQISSQLTYIQIGKQLGISKATVLFWKNILRNEKLIA